MSASGASEPAPGPVGFAFGLALAVLITLAGPLLLFNPPFVYALQDRHAVAEETFGGAHDAVDAATLKIVADIWTDGDFAIDWIDGEPLLDERERSHMRDVARLVRILGGVVILAAVIAAITGTWLRREPRRQGNVMLIAAGSVGAAALVLAIVFAVAFEPAFLAFHRLFFPPGTYLFAPGSNLIGLFPQGFWFDAALAAGIAIVLTALAVIVIGLWRRRSASDARGGLI